MDLRYLRPLVLFSIFTLTRGSLDCFQCTDIDSIDDCHQITVCNKPSEVCYTQASGTPGNLTYTLGCEDRTICGKNMIGRATGVGDTAVNCTECCSVAGCNKALCTTAQITPIKGCNKTCTDDPSFDCANVDATFGICRDVHHAKTVCKHYCGLCCLEDGAWSDWSSWSACSATCGNGTLIRQRTCDNPPASNGGLECPGPGIDKKGCTREPCPIHGQWSTWGNWTSCSATCGFGTTKRHRKCDNPPPGRYGDHCFGEGVDFNLCIVTSCGVDGLWADWTTWSKCSVTCDRGLTTRYRDCSNPAPKNGGRQCIGNNQGYKLCDTNKACPPSGLIYTEWSKWTGCQDNLQYRNRTCFLYGDVISIAHCTDGKNVNYKPCNSSTSLFNDG